MRTYTWDEYYEKYNEWAESTQVRNLSCLTSIGAPTEVAEVIIDLSFHSCAAANRLLRKAVEAGVRFSVEDLSEFQLDLDRELVHRAILLSAPQFSSEDVEELYAGFDEEIVLEVCADFHLPLPEELRDLEDDGEEDDIDLEDAPPKKVGFLWKLLAAFAGAELLDRIFSHDHPHSCDGDCAHCPPHYGYRYGRWYYGHGHQYGCELGGNKGDGSL